MIQKSLFFLILSSDRFIKPYLDHVPVRWLSRLTTYKNKENDSAQALTLPLIVLFLDCCTNCLLLIACMLPLSSPNQKTLPPSLFVRCRPCWPSHICTFTPCFNYNNIHTRYIHLLQMPNQATIRLVELLAVLHVQKRGFNTQVAVETWN